MARLGSQGEEAPDFRGIVHTINIFTLSRDHRNRNFPERRRYSDDKLPMLNHSPLIYFILLPVGEYKISNPYI